MHSGGHSKAYYEEVYSALRNAVKETKDMGLTGSSAKRYLCDIMQRLRVRLLKGTLQINS